MSTMDPRVHPMRTADDPGDLFTVWDAARIPHLAVVGRNGDGRAAVVDRIIEHHAARHTTTVMIYPALNPQLAPVTPLVKGAHEAEAVLQHYLAELHRRFPAIERGSTIPLNPIVIVVDSLEELLSTASNQKMGHRLQLDLEAIAILGKNVGLHLVGSGNELPYLTTHAQRDLGTLAIDGDSDASRIRASSFLPPRSSSARAVQLETGSPS